MGCDIHLVIQTRQPDGTWKDVEPQSVINYDLEPRNYTLFAVLANVRNRDDIWPLSEARGLPNDFDAELPKDFYSGDTYHGEKWLGDHSLSWLLLSEIEWYIKANGHRPAGCSTVGGAFEGWLDGVRRAANGAASADCRLVFGFDS